jgi:hypothetical protein
MSPDTLPAFRLLLLTQDTNSTVAEIPADILQGAAGGASTRDDPAAFDGGSGMTEDERLRGLSVDVLRWLSVVRAESATPFSDARVREALRQVSLTTSALWSVLHDVLTEDGAASSPSIPAGRSPEGP